MTSTQQHEHVFSGNGALCSICGLTLDQVIDLHTKYQDADADGISDDCTVEVDTVHPYFRGMDE